LFKKSLNKLENKDKNLQGQVSTQEVPFKKGRLSGQVKQLVLVVLQVAQLASQFRHCLSFK
jgi:hypothetical protein